MIHVIHWAAIAFGVGALWFIISVRSGRIGIRRGYRAKGDRFTRVIY